jgi:hypothetical protein
VSARSAADREAQFGASECSLTMRPTVPSYPHARRFDIFMRSEDVLYLGNFVVERAAKRQIVEGSRAVLRHEGDSVVAMVS